jgi:hypothetical protein
LTASSSSLVPIVASTGTQSSGGVFPRISNTNRDGMAAIRFPYFARSETKLSVNVLIARVMPT